MRGVGRLEGGGGLEGALLCRRLGWESVDICHGQGRPAWSGPLLNPVGCIQDPRPSPSGTAPAVEAPAP